MRTRLVSLGLVVSLIIAFAAVPATAHAANFSFTCVDPYIVVTNGGVTVFQITKTQVAGPLNTALATGIHQLIASANGASLWALSSNELQVHWDYNPDATKMIVGATFCGSLSAYLTGFLFHCTGTGIAVTQNGLTILSATFNELAGPLYTAIISGDNRYIASGGGASLWALKSNEFQVHRDTQPDSTKVVVSADLCGVIPAVVSTTPASSSYSPVPTYYYPTTGYYVVQPGDNLFRISLKFGRTMAQIANANGITNYNLIYAGQVLVIP